MKQSEQTQVRVSATAAPSPDVLIHRTLAMAIVEGCAWSVMWGFGESFVGPFAVFLKADDFLMSLLCTLWRGEW